MSAIEYTDGTTAKEKAEDLLNGAGAISKIKVDDTVIECEKYDISTAFKTLYDDTTQLLETIISTMGTNIEKMQTADNNLESSTTVDINYKPIIK